MPKIAFVEWADGLTVGGSQWQDIKAQVCAAQADILITNEMPFGVWRPVDETFDREEAQKWVEEHEQSLDALGSLEVGAIISSRPLLIGDRLANEGFSLENGQYTPLHHKHYFPSEQGWHEASWFDKELAGFTVHQISGVNIALLLCTELMMNEEARFYGQKGADLIAVPRASGMNILNWEAACAMASVVSGAYVVSSNRVGETAPYTPEFGGHGLAYAPGGKRLANTDKNNNLKVIELDIEQSKYAKTQYPCHLRY